MSSCQLKNIKNKNIHIVGASGAEGSAILAFLIKSRVKNITAHDFSADAEDLKKNFFKTHLWLKGKEKAKAFSEFLKLPIKLNLKDKYLDGIMDADIIFVSQGWRLYKPNFPFLDQAKEKGIEFSSLTKLYFQLAKGKIISITGTKGKGTVSRLIYETFLKSDNKKNIYLAGNDRRSAQELGKISTMSKSDILVLETSNRQLMIDLGRSPNIGVITNVSPDHIDEHGTFEKYIEIKKSLFRHAKKGDMAILNYDNEITKKIGDELSKQGVEIFFFSRKNKIANGAYLENGKVLLGNKVSRSEKTYICDLADIKIVGKHNIENILAVALAGYLAGAKPEKIRKAIQGFKGLLHRIEFIGEFSSIKFYDDLASTNPESTIAAVRAIPNPKYQIPNTRLILVAGGDDKGMDFTELVKTICKKVDLLILLPGTGSEKMRAGFSNAKNDKKLKMIECSSFGKALEIIKKRAKAGDIVLISPACAHFQVRYIDVLKKSIRNIIVENFG